MRKKVMQLSLGDVITSGERIVGVSAGIRTPAGKLDVVLERADGTRRTAQWWKQTDIGVKDDNV